MYTVITDTSANIPPDLLKENSIAVIPFSFYINGVEKFCTPEFDYEKYYTDMKAGVKITTSQVNPQRYIDYMQPVLEQGSDILFIGMSSGISGSFNSAQMAASQLLEQFPERSIRLVDSLAASLGEGLQVLHAARLRDAGVSLDEAADGIAGLRHKMYQVFTVDDLMYLRRGGRIPHLTAVIGTVLNIKPLLKGDAKGRIVSAGKIRGRKQSIEALAARYEKLVVNSEAQTVGIAHSGCGDDAAYLEQLIKTNKPPERILNVCYEPVTGSHVGPGALALFFEGASGVRAE